MNEPWTTPVARAMQEYDDASPLAPTLATLLAHRRGARRGRTVPMAAAAVVLAVAVSATAYLGGVQRGQSRLQPASTAVGSSAGIRGCLIDVVGSDASAPLVVAQRVDETCLARVTFVPDDGTVSALSAAPCATLILTPEQIARLRILLPSERSARLLDPCRTTLSDAQLWAIGQALTAP